MAESNPLVSVIMPFLNGEAFIIESIASVMGQTLGDFELLLCDDGSTDGSTAIARAWQSRYPVKVRCLEHPGHINRGIAPTRNLGLAAARGAFVALLDADDVWRPRKLAEQVAVLLAHPELGMVCGTACYWNSWNGGEDVLVPTGHIRNRILLPPEASLAVYPFGKTAAPCPSDVLLRREALDEIGGFEEEFTPPGQLYEDQAFLSKLYLAQPVFFSDQVWLDHRQHADSCVAVAMRNGLYDDARQYFLAWFEEYLDHLSDPPPRSVRRALSRALRRYRRPRLDAVLSAPRRVLAPGRRAVHRLRESRGSLQVRAGREID